MLYLSVDIETTGLNEETCQTVEFAAVLADTTRPDDVVEMLPSFHCYVAHESYVGEPYALSMHPHIFRALATGKTDVPLINALDLSLSFELWLRKRFDSPKVGRLAAAGKNFGSFDLQFLKKLPGMKNFFGHRFLDPAPYFFNPLQDEKLPDLATCLRRAGVNKAVAHNALEDAQDVVRCLNYAFVHFVMPN